MMAKAIGPQNTVGAIGIMPSTVEIAVSMIGRKRELLASTAASPARSCPAPLGLDLADQDDGVLGDHADQREDAQDGDEAERPAGQQQRGDDADQAQRRHAQDDEQALEALQLDHQHGEHDEQHHRHHGDHRGLRFGALLDRAADGDVVGRAAGSACSSSIVGRERVDHALRQRARRHVGLHRQGRHPVAPPDQREVLRRSRSVANWLSGTVRPSGSGTCRVGRVVSETRCSSVARATTLTR